MLAPQTLEEGEGVPHDTGLEPPAPDEVEQGLAPFLNADAHPAASAQVACMWWGEHFAIKTLLLWMRCVFLL